MGWLSVGALNHVVLLFHVHQLALWHKRNFLYNVLQFVLLFKDVHSFNSKNLSEEIVDFELAVP